MSQYNNQAHINEYNSQQPQTTETKANNTVVAYNRPVKIYGDAGALIEYQPMLPYMSNGNGPTKMEVNHEKHEPNPHTMGNQARRNIRRNCIRCHGETT